MTIAMIGGNRVRSTRRKVFHGWLYGLAVGFAVAFLCIAASVTIVGPHWGPGARTKWQEVPVLSRLQTAVLDGVWAGILGAVAGSMAGAVIGLIGRRLEMVTSLTGMAGGICCLFGSPFDGWMSIGIPFCAFWGTVVGFIVGGLVRITRLAVRRGRLEAVTCLIGMVGGVCLSIVLNPLFDGWPNPYDPLVVTAPVGALAGAIIGSAIAGILRLIRRWEAAGPGKTGQ